MASSLVILASVDVGQWHAFADTGHRSDRRVIDSCQDAQERGLAGAVMPDEPEPVAGAQVDVDVTQGLDDSDRLRSARKNAAADTRRRSQVLPDRARARMVDRIIDTDAI